MKVDRKRNYLFHSFELLVLNFKLTKLNKYLPSKFDKSDQCDA